MRDHYDFQNAERGKFYRPDATLRIPVYLDEHLQTYLSAAAERKGTSLNELVNELLSQDISIVEAMK